MLVSSLVACVISCVAPNWIKYNDLDLNKNFFKQLLHKAGQFLLTGDTFRSAGLFVVCPKNGECRWENILDSKKRFMPEWIRPTQGLFAGGVICLLITVSISAFGCCCCPGSSPLYSTLGGLASVATTCLATALAVFVGFVVKNFKLGSDGIVSLDWAFYCGIGGVIACLVSVILFFIDGCNHREQRRYLHAGYPV